MGLPYASGALPRQGRRERGLVRPIKGISSDPMDPSLDNLEIARRLGIALAVGALPGLERQRHRTPTGRRSFAGLRTFTLISLFGAVSVWISLAVFSWFIAVAFLGFAAIISLSYRALSER